MFETLHFQPEPTITKLLGIRLDFQEFFEVNFKAITRIRMDFTQIARNLIRTHFALHIFRPQIINILAE